MVNSNLRILNHNWHFSHFYVHFKSTFLCEILYLFCPLRYEVKLYLICYHQFDVCFWRNGSVKNYICFSLKSLTKKGIRRLVPSVLRQGFQEERKQNFWLSDRFELMITNRLLFELSKYILQSLATWKTNGLNLNDLHTKAYKSIRFASRNRTFRIMKIAHGVWNWFFFHVKNWTKKMDHILA